jgi:hypothetical protein
MATDFEATVRASIASNSNWFANMEGPVEPHAVELLEGQLGATLPDDFRAFLTEFGCGYFGKLIVFSARPESDWYLLKRTQPTLPSAFVAVSDDEAGGFYGFQLAGETCLPEVLYLYPDEADGPQPVASTFKDYVVEMGLP